MPRSKFTNKQEIYISKNYRKGAVLRLAKELGCKPYDLYNLARLRSFAKPVESKVIEDTEFFNIDKHKVYA